MSDLLQEKHMTFLEHVEELRWFLIRSLIAVVIVLPFTFWAARPLIDYIVASSAPAGFSLQYFKLMEPFLTELKISLILAVSIAFPYIAWQFWRFVAPALYNHERSKVKFWSILGWVLFITGIAFSYLVILPFIVNFSLSFQRENVRPMLGLGDFISMTVLLLLAFGLIFQLPIVIMILVGLGIVKKSTLSKQRPMIIILIAFTSALLTPPDILSQLAMAIPTYLLFEISLLLSRPPKNVAIKGVKDDINKM